MNIIKKTSIAALLSVFAFSALVTLPAKAEVNPFEAQGIVSIVGHDGEEKGKCGEGKKAMKKGKCGEGKCGEGKKAMKKGKCGEGKCGEGKKKTKKCGG